MLAAILNVVFILCIVVRSVGLQQVERQPTPASHGVAPGIHSKGVVSNSEDNSWRCSGGLSSRLWYLDTQDQKKIVERLGDINLVPFPKPDKTISLQSSDGANRSILMYSPSSEHTGSRPCVVYVQGSGFCGVSLPIDGQDGMIFESDLRVLEFLVQHGYVVAMVDYSGIRDGSVFPAPLYDVGMAVRHLSLRADSLAIDPDGLIIWGSSSGGWIASFLGVLSGDVSPQKFKMLNAIYGDIDDATQPLNLKCVIDFYGPVDFAHLDQESEIKFHDHPGSPESQFMGFPLQKDAKQVQRANPLQYVDATGPPFLLAHGDADPLVPINQSERLFDALQAKGVPSWFIKLHGASHGSREFFQGSMLRRVLSFLSDNCGPRKIK